MKSSIKDILKQTKIDITPEIFNLISLTPNDFSKVLENPELSPRMTAPFMIFKDKYEITLLLDETDFAGIRNNLQNAGVETGFRLLTFEIVLDFNVFGFLAEVARILAEAEIPIVALSAFSRDHILIKQENLAKALKVLSPYVEELC